jgi:hypothetical protein
MLLAMSPPLQTTIIMSGSTTKSPPTLNWKKVGVASPSPALEGGSVTTPVEGTHVYEADEIVNLFAEADTENHYHFVEWTGDVSTVGNVTSAATTIIMSDSYSITANFELEEGWYSLTISSTEGGSVTQPSEIISVHAANRRSILWLSPNEGYEFLRWTGDVSTIDDIYAAEATITMNASYSITASFESWHPDPVAQLMISSTRGGSVTTPVKGHSCVLSAPKSALWLNLTKVASLSSGQATWTPLLIYMRPRPPSPWTAPTLSGPILVELVGASSPPQLMVPRWQRKYRFCVSSEMNVC